jgi:hypothetical protein
MVMIGIGGGGRESWRTELARTDRPVEINPPW